MADRCDNSLEAGLNSLEADMLRRSEMIDKKEWLELMCKSTQSNLYSGIESCWESSQLIPTPDKMQVKLSFPFLFGHGGPHSIRPVPLALALGRTPTTIACDLVRDPVICIYL